MGKRKILFVFFPVLAILLLPCVISCKESSGIEALKNALLRPAAEISKKLEGNVCVMDFSDAGDQRYTSEFGQKVAELLTDNIFSRKKNHRYVIIDRKEIVKIMRDSVIFGDDPQTIERLRTSAKMDVLVSGSYSVVGEKISVSIKATSIKTGGLLASSSILIKETVGLKKMLAHRFMQMGVPSDRESEVAKQKDVLELETGIYYEGGDGRLYPLREGMVLTSKDNYAIYFRPKQECYVYIYQADYSKKAFKLFPNVKYSTAENPVKVNSEYWLPAGKDYLFLDENTGEETIYIFASRMPSDSLENIKDATLDGIENTIKLMGVAGRRGTETVQKVKGTKTGAVELISRRLFANGDFFYKLSFIHK